MANTSDRLTYFTTCPRNCYSTCGLKVTVENNKIISIETNPANLATPEAPCLKGLSYYEREFSANRILTPLKRNNKSGTFNKISWDDALDEITEKLKYLKNIYGPKSILYYSGSGTKGLLNGIGAKFWRLFGGYTTTFGELCWPAGLEATRLTLGENKHNDPWDLANAKLIIIWGKNSSETNIHQTLFINQALENGARMIVIDPRRTQTSERAELLIQPRPGTDGALALGIANLIIKNNFIDKDFIEKHILGLNEFSEMVKEYPPEKVSSITDVPEKYIYLLAELIGNTKPMTICAGFGMQRYTNSGQTMRAIIALTCITGNIGKTGAGWVYANLQSHVFSKTKDPVACFPPEKEDELVRVSISVAKLGRDMLAQTDPPLKMIWVERGNPVISNPETPAVMKAFKNLEFRVVVDQFMTDTAKEADIILPAKTIFEQSDIMTAYWHPYIQWKQKIFESPGKVKPESEIYYLLAKRMEFPEHELRNTFPEMTDQGIEKYLNEMIHSSGLSVEKIKNGPVFSIGHQEVAFSDHIFPTQSGKIELISEEAKTRWNVDPLPRYSEPVEFKKSTKFPLHLLTPNTKNRIHSQFNNLEMIRSVSPKPLLIIHPEDARERKIRDGDWVKVFNDRGKIQIEAKIEFSVKRGCVCITNGWWRQDGVCVNDLSMGRETDMGFGTAFHDNLVDVEKI